MCKVNLVRLRYVVFSWYWLVSVPVKAHVHTRGSLVYLFVVTRPTFRDQIFCSRKLIRCCRYAGHTRSE
jgi:hypothetical protein